MDFMFRERRLSTLFKKDLQTVGCLVVDRMKLTMKTNSSFAKAEKCVS
jgi:hypothetical protein